MTTWPSQASVLAGKSFYGENRGPSGPDPIWESASLVTVQLPWRAQASWDKNIKIKSLRLHRRCADSLKRVLTLIWKEFGENQTAIERAGMHLIGGGYNWRAMRGKDILSMHSYGCAVDFDPVHNALGNQNPAMNPRVVAAFESEGWTWGGRWSPKARDGMHFQAASV